MLTARIGDWGTPFSLAPCIAANPIGWANYCDIGVLDPGVEVGGDDYIYQDVQLGSSPPVPPGSPQHFTLTFSFNMESYNDNGYTDYFYAVLEDPASTPDHPLIPNGWTPIPIPIWDPLDQVTVPPPTVLDYFVDINSLWGANMDTPTFTKSGWQTQSYTFPDTLNGNPTPGQTVRILFGEHQDGWGDQTVTYLDDVSLSCSP